MGIKHNFVVNDYVYQSEILEEIYNIIIHRNLYIFLVCINNQKFVLFFIKIYEWNSIRNYSQTCL